MVKEGLEGERGEDLSERVASGWGVIVPGVSGERETKRRPERGPYRVDGTAEGNRVCVSGSSGSRIRNRLRDRTRGPESHGPNRSL